MVQEMWKAGVLKKEENGTIAVIDGEEERLAQKEKYEMEQAMLLQDRRQTQVFHQGNEEESSVINSQQFIDADDRDKKE